MVLRIQRREYTHSCVFSFLQKIYNHPSIEQFSSGGLITFRVITVADRDGVAEVIAAYMEMPMGNKVANHAGYGGLVVEFDLKKQEFLEVFAKKPVPSVFTKHPETGALVTGENLDVWPALSELSVQAHRAFPGVFAIGWDVVYTEDGAMLLEGNTRWGSRLAFFVGRNAYVRKYLELLRDEQAQGNPLRKLL